MLAHALSPFRGEVGATYDADFIYLSNRGAVAERWAHTPGFGRHAVAPDALSLLNKTKTRVAEYNLKSSRFFESSIHLDWAKLISDASEFLNDCLTVLPNVQVSTVYAEARFCSPAPNFASVRDRISSQILQGVYRHQPTKQAVFDDLSIALLFKQGLTTILTGMGPMRRPEMRAQLDGEIDLEEFPESVLFVQRRLEVKAVRDGKESRFDSSEARERLKSLLEMLSSAPEDVPQYVGDLLGERAE